MENMEITWAPIERLHPYANNAKKHVRCLIISGKIPRVKCGKKYLIDIDLLQDHLTKYMQGNG